MKKNLLIVGLVLIVALMALHSRKNNQPQPSTQPDIQVAESVGAATLASRAPTRPESAPAAPASTNNGMEVGFTGLYVK